MSEKWEKWLVFQLFFFSFRAKPDWLSFISWLHRILKSLSPRTPTIKFSSNICCKKCQLLYRVLRGSWNTKMNRVWSQWQAKLKQPSKKKAALTKVITMINQKRKECLLANSSTIKPSQSPSKNIQPAESVVWCLRINGMLSLLYSYTFIISQTVPRQRKVTSKGKIFRGL